MLSVVTRPLTATERAELELRRARLRERIAAEAERSHRTVVEAGRVSLVLPGFFGLVMVFNLVTRHFDAALAAGVGTLLFAGLFVWLRFRPIEPSVRDEHEVEGVALALGRGEAEVLEFAVAAVVLVRGPAHGGEGGEGVEELEPLGVLLRTEGDELVLVGGASWAECVPRRGVRVVCITALRLVRIETFGEPIAAEQQTEGVVAGHESKFAALGDELWVWSLASGQHRRFDPSLGDIVDLIDLIDVFDDDREFARELAALANGPTTQSNTSS